MSSLNHQPLTALVTGATSGLGKEIALRLARDDLQVIVVGRDVARFLRPGRHRLGVVCDASPGSDGKRKRRNGLTD